MPCPPGHKHWHSATAITAMTHIAVTEALDGKNVTWMEKVSDAEYLAGRGQINRNRVLLRTLHNHDI